MSLNKYSQDLRWEFNLLLGGNLLTSQLYSLAVGNVTYTVLLKVKRKRHFLLVLVDSNFTITNVRFEFRLQLRPIVNNESRDLYRSTYLNSIEYSKQYTKKA